MKKQFCPYAEHFFLWRKKKKNSMIIARYREKRISGGFITVTKEKTTILTESASWDNGAAKETI